MAASPVQKPGPQVRASTLAALDALYAENRAAAARLRACRELYLSCDAEQLDRALAAGYGPRLDEKPSYAIIDPLQVASAEIVAAYGVHHHRAKTLITLANDLSLRFPALLEAMETGRMDESTAAMLARHMRTVDGPVLDRVQRDVVDWLLAAINSGRRPGREAILNETDRIIRRHDPEGVLLRRARAFAERNVRLRRSVDGMADLNAHLSATDALAISEALDEIARARKREDPGGTGKGQARADALVDALLGPAEDSPAKAPAASPTHGESAGAGDAGDVDDDDDDDAGTNGSRARGGDRATGSLLASIRPNITVLAPLGPDGEPEVYLPRGGPATIDALIALLSRSVGATISVPDTTPGAADSEPHGRRYRLSPELARRIRLRDGTCRHPGCSVPAEDCDIDHCQPFNQSDPSGGGLSLEANLVCLCRQHHRFKTFHGWRYHLARDGSLTVTTNTGHILSTEPAGPLAIWRRTIAEADAQADADADAEPPPEEQRRPWLSPSPQSTHWHRRVKDITAEREANMFARYAPRPAQDPDPPPF